MLKYKENLEKFSLKYKEIMKKLTIKKSQKNLRDIVNIGGIDF